MSEMSLKLKITLVTMLLIAGFLVTRLGLFLNGGIKTATLANISNKAGEIKEKNTSLKDSDHDGIPDIYEAYYHTDPFNPNTDGDGYLDGEEVAEGCSPIIPAPNDCGFKGRIPQNVTEHFSSLMLGGLLSNDLKGDPASSSYLGLLIDDALRTKQILLSVDDINSKKTTSIITQTPQKYLNAIESVFKKYFFINKYGNLNSMDYENFDFSSYAENLNQLYGELIQISPPQDWEQTHENLVKFTLELKNYFSNLNDQKRDPLKALITISNTESLLSEYAKIFKEISNKARGEGLKTEFF